MISSASGEWTVRRVLAWTTGYLREGGVEAARFEAESLLAHALNADRLQLYLTPNRDLNEAERTRYRELIRQRRQGTPLAHLLEVMPFMDATLHVHATALIPRPETEELVESIVCEVEATTGVPRRAIDLGTGSGAIAIALALRWPTTHVVAVDLSPEALALAHENAHRNGVDDRISLVRADWGSALRERFELIVANPPYVATESWPDLPTDVRDHEPKIALDGGPQGTRQIRRIATDAPRLLAPHGHLYLEIGADQRDLVRTLLTETVDLVDVDVRPDRAGRPRFAHARGRP